MVSLALAVSKWGIVCVPVPFSVQVGDTVVCVPVPFSIQVKDCVCPSPFLYPSEGKCVPLFLSVSKWSIVCTPVPFSIQVRVSVSLSLTVSKWWTVCVPVPFSIQVRDTVVCVPVPFRIQVLGSVCHCSFQYPSEVKCVSLPISVSKWGIVCVPAHFSIQVRNSVCPCPFQYPKVSDSEPNMNTVPVQYKCFTFIIHWTPHCLGAIPLWIVNIVSKNNHRQPTPTHAKR